MDWRPIHIIKIKLVQIGGKHLRVSFLLPFDEIQQYTDSWFATMKSEILHSALACSSNEKTTTELKPKQEEKVKEKPKVQTIQKQPKDSYIISEDDLSNQCHSRFNFTLASIPIITVINVIIAPNIFPTY